MKKSRLIKRMIVSLLVLTLVVVQGVPVMAAEAQPQESKAAAEKAVGAVNVSNLAVKEMRYDGFVFSHSAIPEDADLYCQYSTNKAFDSKKAKVETKYGDTLGYDYLEPGVTYYVRAYATRYDDDVEQSYSNVVTVKAPVAEVTSINTEIANTSITLSMYAGYGQHKGFQIARKVGKKYKVLTTTTDNVFKDTGLKKNTKYTYRVRAYYYNTDTKKTVYGSYEYKTVQTGKAALNLKAKATKKNAIKLTWTKVPGAAGYDIYRCVGNSQSNTVKSGEDYNFDKYELIKSLGKKKSSFTNKKLVSGESYTYTVKAFKNVKKKKVYFTEDYASASTKFSFNKPVIIEKQAQNPKTGKMKITWKPVPKAKGYLIEKYDDTKGDWVTQKNVKKVTTTSYTLPASPLGKTINYRIRAYNGKKYSMADEEVPVTGHLAVVTGVKAKSTSDGIKVSWKAVPKATYYKVYRTTSSKATYDADKKAYTHAYNKNKKTVEEMVFKAATSTNYYCTVGSSNTKRERDYEAAEKLGYNGNTEKIKGTSVIDYSYMEHDLTYDNDKVVKDDTTSHGPESDVTYYYYVMAHYEAKDAAGNTTSASSYGDSKAASASMAGKAAVKAPTIKKVKAGKKSATITYKKVKNAKKYYIYRADSKKGALSFIGSTTKTKFTDKKLKSKKTYRYAVKAVSTNSWGADNYSKLSKAKSVKVK